VGCSHENDRAGRLRRKAMGGEVDGALGKIYHRGCQSMTKKARVADLLHEGFSVADAAREAGCSKSWAYAISAELNSLRLVEIHAMVTETLRLTRELLREARGDNEPGSAQRDWSTDEKGRPN